LLKCWGSIYQRWVCIKRSVAWIAYKVFSALGLDDRILDNIIFLLVVNHKTVELTTIKSTQAHQTRRGNALKLSEMN
jgi:hypothetical protein